jgi:iron(III) transport system substrate-binding protein
MNFLKPDGHRERAVHIARLAAVTLAATLCAACDRSTPREEVVVYTSIDEPFARRILADFQQKTGIRALAVVDAEAGKTAGLVRRIQREAARPRCDVWWSSEILGTIELARAGLLEPYDSPAAADIPTEWRDPQHRWTAVGARARVLAFDTRRVNRGQLPTSWQDLADSPLLARFTLANPNFGTTRGHVAALFAYWGEPAGRAFLQTLRDQRVPLADGNAHAVRMLAAGQADLCMTDTDDVWAAQRRGEPVECIYPSTSADGPIIWTPCSIALLRGGPHPAAARKLIDYLVSADVERALALSDLNVVPLRALLRDELRTPEPYPQPLGWERIADVLPAAMAAARELLLE